jgi:hypothetical protein
MSPASKTLEPKPMGGGERAKQTIVWNILNIPRPTTNAEILVKEDVSLGENREIDHRSETRDSTRKNSAKKAIEAASSPRMLWLVQPQFWPSVVA